MLELFVYFVIAATLSLTVDEPHSHAMHVQPKITIEDFSKPEMEIIETDDGLYLTEKKAGLL